MLSDEEGFLYPHVDVTICIECNLCEKVCPVINQNEPRKPFHVYAAKNADEEIRLKSSSGGLFTGLAALVIRSGGVVFGVKFNKQWEVVHSYTESMDGLAVFRGSKYVQSKIGDSYSQVEHFLKVGREVLFSGTPCQIAGLKRFLRKEYTNLLTVDVVCHGVPSPMIWSDYLNGTIARQCEKKSVLLHPISKENVIVEDVSFRDKSTGWKKYSFALALSTSSVSGEKYSFTLVETLDKNIYMQGFLKDLYLRPSCYQCPARSLKSGADITIGDYWGVSRYYSKFDDDKGVGLLLVNSENGRDYCSRLNWCVKDASYAQALSSNPVLEHNVNVPKLRYLFWKQYSEVGIDAIQLICYRMQPSVVNRGVLLGKKIFKRIIGKR
jgi:coenzyme F420-reducing hydrogenase beta subunit